MVSFWKVWEKILLINFYVAAFEDFLLPVLWIVIVPFFLWMYWKLALVLSFLWLSWKIWEAWKESNVIDLCIAGCFIALLPLPTILLLPMQLHMTFIALVITVQVLLLLMAIRMVFNIMPGLPTIALLIVVAFQEEKARWFFTASDAALLCTYFIGAITFVLLYFLHTNQLDFLNSRWVLALGLIATLLGPLACGVGWLLYQKLSDAVVKMTPDEERRLIMLGLLCWCVEVGLVIIYYG